MSALHTINGKPVTTQQSVAGQAPAATHKPEAGKVGATGKHGNIGSNGFFHKVGHALEKAGEEVLHVGADVVQPGVPK